LSLSPEEVLQHARNLAGDFAPLDIEACSVELFSTTEVIYISIGAGREELRAMHRAFNSGGLAFKEPFTYHPHVTLAQELPSDQVVGLHEIARRRWAEYRGPRTFRAGNLTFVRNNGNAWIDIAELTLGAVPSLT
jgi:2'-5' RNA ligase